MMRKKISQLVISVIVSGLFVSCWDDFTERTFYSANIESFAFGAHDSCEGIENYVFNINQLSDTGLIYNLDSLPYGSNVSNLFPTLKIQSTNGNMFMNDSLWEDADSIDFTSPVIFKNTSADGLITRVYKIKVNVHQVDPDSMIMNPQSENFPTNAAKNKILIENGTFYSFFELSGGGMSSYLSTDKGLTWHPRTVTGLSENVNVNSLCVYNSKYYITTKSEQLYSSTDGLSWAPSGDGTKIFTLFGQLKKKYMSETEPAHLIGIARNTSGELYFARSLDGISWTLGSAVDVEFPVMEYALAKGKTVTGVEFYTIATGLNANRSFSTKVWSTETGLDWVPFDDISNIRRAISPRIGATIFFYDNELICFGGVDPQGTYHKDILISKDKGKGWLAASDHWGFLKMKEGLAYSTVYVEHVEDVVNAKDREFIWLFGGTTKSSLNSTVWRGYLNKMIFARR